MRIQHCILLSCLAAATGCATATRPNRDLPEDHRVPEIKSQAFERFEAAHPEFRSCHAKMAKIRSKASATIEFLATVEEDGKIAKLELKDAGVTSNRARGCDLSMRGTIKKGDSVSRLIYRYGWDAKGQGDRSKYRQYLLTVRGSASLPPDDEIIASMDQRITSSN